MCGIVGFFNCGSYYNIKKATEIVSHRGPDNEGIKWFDETNSGLGHRRLSIIDLSTLGNQPMSSSDNKLWIVFNGEIYNYKQIKEELINYGYCFRSDSDTEVILVAYQHWGEKCLQKFNGIFGFIIYEPAKNNIFIARDRIGVKPLYYYYENNSLIVASEIKSILSSKVYNKEVDYNSLFTPVHYQVSPYTGF